VDKVGGPSVKPYQPAGVWETGTLPQSRAHTYVMDHGESLYRRSLYTIWRKSALIPDMDAFDAPNRMASCTRRQRSNTPLQALVTMNDPQWLEAARRLAERVMLKSPTTDARLDYLGRLVLGRPWAPDDRAVLVAELGQFRATYAGQTKAATELVEQGESRPNPAIAPTELAPWMLIASTALNLDATLNK
jgi:FAD/FMN-containing dehydrogenase